MAKWKIRAKRLYKEWRSNFLVWLIQSLGGTSMIGAVARAFWQSIHHSVHDWIFLGAMFAVGLLLVVAALWIQSNKEPRYSEVELDDKLARQRTEIEEQIPSIMINGTPVAGPAKTAADALQEASASPLLSPLQAKAVRLAKDLRVFVRELGPKPELDPAEYSRLGGETFIFEQFKLQDPWWQKLRGTYALKFRDRVQEIYQQSTQRGMQDYDLRVDADTVKIENLNLVQKKLWELASRLDEEAI
jgi:hypothetical protein